MIWLSRVRTVSSATPTMISIVVPPSDTAEKLGLIHERMIGNIAITPRKIAPISVILLSEL